MTDNATPKRPHGGPRPKIRPDDRRGAKKGEPGTVINPGGVAIGQAAHVPTEENRRIVREMACVFPQQAEWRIAKKIGISPDTLKKYYQDDIDDARTDMLMNVGGQVVSRGIDMNAVDANGEKIQKGDFDAQRFILARMGGWTQKQEVSGPGGGPIPVANVDLSNLTDEQLAQAHKLSRALQGLPAEDPEFDGGEDDDADDD